MVDESALKELLAPAGRKGDARGGERALVEGHGRFVIVVVGCGVYSVLLWGGRKRVAHGRRHKKQCGYRIE